MIQTGYNAPDLERLSESEIDALAEKMQDLPGHAKAIRYPGGERARRFTYDEQTGYLDRFRRLISRADIPRILVVAPMDFEAREFGKTYDRLKDSAEIDLVEFGNEEYFFIPLAFYWQNWFLALFNEPELYRRYVSTVYLPTFERFRDYLAINAGGNLPELALSAPRPINSKWRAWLQALEASDVETIAAHFYGDAQNPEEFIAGLDDEIGFLQDRGWDVKITEAAGIHHGPDARNFRELRGSDLQKRLVRHIFDIARARGIDTLIYFTLVKLWWQQQPMYWRYLVGPGATVSDPDPDIFPHL